MFRVRTTIAHYALHDRIFQGETRNNTDDAMVELRAQDVLERKKRRQQRQQTTISMVLARQCSMLLGLLLLSSAIHPTASSEERRRRLFRNLLRLLRSTIHKQFRRLVDGRGRFFDSSAFGETGEPRPAIVENFLTPSEARELLDRYEPLLHESSHVSSGSGTILGRSRYRTSRSIRLPPLGDPLVLDLERRAAALSGFDHGRCQDFQLACYGVGELYGLHRDDAAMWDGSSGANRAATVLVYLREPGPEFANASSHGKKAKKGEFGGETLFTGRPIEEERDPDTGLPFQLEEGALKLFRAYCDNPLRGHMVVEPRVGRAVTWRNWLGDDLRRFASGSTHGSCPVKASGQEKCVMQQWISKSDRPLPLRDRRVAAIFPAGADMAYQRHAGRQPQQPTDTHCFPDVSSWEGRYFRELCVRGYDDASSDVSQLDDGPYSGVGSLSISATVDGGLAASAAAEWVGLGNASSDFSFSESGGFTVSFWARNITTDTVLLSIGDNIQLRRRNAIKDGSSDPTELLELTGKVGNWEERVHKTQIEFHPAETDWVWFTLSWNGSLARATLALYSHRGKELGRGSLENFHCMDGTGRTPDYDVRMMYPWQDAEHLHGREDFRSPSPVALQGPNAAGLASEPPMSVSNARHANMEGPRLRPTGDVSFIVMHRAVFDSSLDEAISLRKEANRYDLQS